MHGIRFRSTFLILSIICSIKPTQVTILSYFSVLILPVS